MSPAATPRALLERIKRRHSNSVIKPANDSNKQSHRDGTLAWRPSDGLCNDLFPFNPSKESSFPRPPCYPFRLSSRHIHRSRNESLKQESTEKERNPVFFFHFCFVPSTILPDRQQLINNFILVRLRDHAKDAHHGEGKKSLTLSLKSRNFRFPSRPKMYPFRPVLLRNCCFHRDFDSFSLLSA